MIITRSAFILIILFAVSFFYSNSPEVHAMQLRLAEFEAQEPEDPAPLINHAPVLKSVGLGRNEDNLFRIYIFIGKAHEDIRYLNTISEGGVMVEIWLRTGSKGWVKCHKGQFAEETVIVTEAEAYLGEIDSTAYVSYDVACIYSFDYASCPASGKTGLIQSPLSNIITKNTALYTEASDWAVPELENAEKYGLIPVAIRGEDMTKPISREEFAELSICLYERTTGKKAVPAAPNPFTDTANPEVLKAKELGITAGTSLTTFSPEEAINREQAATMLGRTVRLIASGFEFSSEDSPAYSDGKHISSWALENVLLMSKIGAMEGENGKFMPRAVTDAQKKAGYAAASREQAVAMCVHIYDWYQSITENDTEQPEIEIPVPDQ